MIHVVGSVNLDYIARVKRLPRPGETVLGRSLEKSPGGKGANQALAARRAGASVRLIACVGRDEDSRLATSHLRRDSVDLSDLVTVPAATGVALVQIDETGENSITVVSGANEAVTPALVEDRLKGLASGDLVLLQQEIPQEATSAVLWLAARAGATSVLNAAPILPDTPDIAMGADLVIANETEFLEISGHAPSCEAAEIWCRAANSRLALTLGAEGAILAGMGEVQHIHPPRIDPVDTVGAGDTFCGYLAAGLHSGLGPEKALAMAVRASARACLSHGAQPAIPWKADVAV